jgi:hypothetical protein
VTYPYDGLLEMYGVIGVCPLFTQAGTSSRAPKLNGLVRVARSTNWIQDVLTWNAALSGVPTLAEVNQTSSCAAYNTGHTDYVEGDDRNHIVVPGGRVWIVGNRWWETVRDHI